MLGSQRTVTEEVLFKITFQNQYFNPEDSIEYMSVYNSIIHQGEFILRKFKLMCFFLLLPHNLFLKQRPNWCHLQYTRHKHYSRYYLNANGKSSSEQK